MAPSVAERLHAFSFEEYAEVAARSPNRVEHWEGAILDVSGGSPRHSALCNNIGGTLRVQLRGRACRSFDSNLRVRSIAANRATYADLTVVCGALELDPADRTGHTILNPTVLVEVQSPSTESDDHGPKLDCYKAIASVHVILLVAHDRPHVVVHTKQADGSLLRTDHDSGVIELTDIGCRLPIAEIYEDLPAA
jgi:Uma2 family endonuclease